MARRLPALIREAISLAWATSRRDTAASIGLNVAAGVEDTVPRHIELLVDLEVELLEQGAEDEVGGEDADHRQLRLVHL